MTFYTLDTALHLLMWHFLLSTSAVNAVFGVICSTSLLLRHVRSNKEFISVLSEWVRSPLPSIFLQPNPGCTKHHPTAPTFCSSCSWLIANTFSGNVFLLQSDVKLFLITSIFCNSATHSQIISCASLTHFNFLGSWWSGSTNNFADDE